MDEQLKAIYDEIYSSEEAYATPHQEKIDYAMNWCTRKGLREIFDLGCGRGEYTRALNTLPNVQCVGFEFSEVCYEKYLASEPDMFYNRSIDEVVSTTRSNKVCDGVICMDVLEHIDPKKLQGTLTKVSTLADEFLFLVAEGSDKHCGHELHISNHAFHEWFDMLGEIYEITNSVSGFHKWPYIHIFECKVK